MLGERRVGSLAAARDRNLCGSIVDRAEGISRWSIEQPSVLHNLKAADGVELPACLRNRQTRGVLCRRLTLSPWPALAPSVSIAATAVSFIPRTRLALRNPHFYEGDPRLLGRRVSSALGAAAFPSGEISTAPGGRSRNSTERRSQKGGAKLGDLNSSVQLSGKLGRIRDPWSDEKGTRGWFLSAPAKTLAAGGGVVISREIEFRCLSVSSVAGHPSFQPSRDEKFGESLCRGARTLP